MLIATLHAACSYSLVAMTPDSESGSPSSNLGRSYPCFFFINLFLSSKSPVALSDLGFRVLTRMARQCLLRQQHSKPFMHILPASSLAGGDS